MPPQISREIFVQAMAEMGHDPKNYNGKKLTIQAVAELYELDCEILMEAIEHRRLNAQFDFALDTLMIDAIDAAHLYYCIQVEAPLYSTRK